MADPTISSNGDNAKAPISPSALLWPFFAAAVALALVLVWAEGSHKWFVAQASLITILLLVVLAGWTWTRVTQKDSISPDEETHRRTLRNLLIIVGIGYLAAGTTDSLQPTTALSQHPVTHVLFTLAFTP